MRAVHCPKEVSEHHQKYLMDFYVAVISPNSPLKLRIHLARYRKNYTMKVKNITNLCLLALVVEEGRNATAVGIVLEPKSSAITSILNDDDSSNSCTSSVHN